MSQSKKQVDRSVIISMIAIGISFISLYRSSQSNLMLAQNLSQSLALAKISGKLAGIYELKTKSKVSLPRFLEIGPDGEVFELNFKKDDTCPLIKIGRIEAEDYAPYLVLNDSQAFKRAKLIFSVTINKPLDFEVEIPGHSLDWPVYQRVNSVEETRNTLIKKYGN